MRGVVGLRAVAPVEDVPRSHGRGLCEECRLLRARRDELRRRPVPDGRRRRQEAGRGEARRDDLRLRLRGPPRVGDLGLLDGPRQGPRAGGHFPPSSAGGPARRRQGVALRRRRRGGALRRFLQRVAARRDERRRHGRLGLHLQDARVPRRPTRRLARERRHVQVRVLRGPRRRLLRQGVALRGVAENPKDLPLLKFRGAHRPRGRFEERDRRQMGRRRKPERGLPLLVLDAVPTGESPRRVRGSQAEKQRRRPRADGHHRRRGPSPRRHRRRKS
mmetsp:Transcript_15203/g.49509  ORF Transcript_15203/g.49509 Transcript_15203/m.49509 type:complete len:275 (+) Transcript_15203:4625-5449(+)